MKFKLFFFLGMAIILGLSRQIFAQTSTASTTEIKSTESQKKKGEKVFIKHADKCLTIIEKAAFKMSINGVMIIAFIPGEITSTWISKIKVVGTLTNKDSNLLAVASCKAAEMADTFKDSGSGVRKPLKGENGYKGGVIKKVGSGYILTVFSGASGDQDVAAATEGMDYLYKYFPKTN